MLKRSVGANTLRKLGDSATHRRAARRSLLDGGVPEAKSEFCKQRVGGYKVKGLQAVPAGLRSTLRLMEP